MVGVRDGCQVAFGDGVPLGAWKQGAERRLGVGAERRLGVGAERRLGGADRRLEQLLEGGGGDLSERCVNDTANPGLGGCAHSVI